MFTLSLIHILKITRSLIISSVTKSSHSESILPVVFCRYLFVFSSRNCHKIQKTASLLPSPRRPLCNCWLIHLWCCPWRRWAANMNEAKFRPIYYLLCCKRAIFIYHNQEHTVKYLLKLWEYTGGCEKTGRDKLIYIFLFILWYRIVNGRVYTWANHIPVYKQAPTITRPLSLNWYFHHQINTILHDGITYCTHCIK